MITETDFQYRILQSSLSRFSIYLNKAETLDDVAACLIRNAKYLCNYSECRFHYFHLGRWVTYSIDNRTTDVKKGTDFFFDQTEAQVFDTSIPYYNKTEVTLPTGENIKEVWIWKFDYSSNSNHAGMVVSLMSEGETRFSKQQIPIIKIISEMIYTKTRMIILLDDLRQKGEDLFSSYKKLEESNALISKILSEQEKTIKERTRELTMLNKKLVKLIQFNSHHIREPLTRIMGLMSLYEMETPAQFFATYWPLLEESVLDMDRTIRQVISSTENIDDYENLFD